MTADSDVAGSSALSLLSYVSVTSQVNTAQVVSNSAMPLQGQTVSKSSEKQMSPDYAQSKSREIKTSDKQDEHSNRSLEAQYRTDASFLQHYEPPEWNIPRMLIVLPESIEKCDPYKLSVDDFQLYFLCERDHHGNTNAVKSNSFSSSGRLIVATAASTTPYTAKYCLHPIRREGYELLHPTEFHDHYGLMFWGCSGPSRTAGRRRKLLPWRQFRLKMGTRVLWMGSYRSQGELWRQWICQSLFLRRRWSTLYKWMRQPKLAPVHRTIACPWLSPWMERTCDG